MNDAAPVIQALNLEPHPEGGYYRETYRSAAGPEGRGHVSAIYFLLPAGVTSRWHRLDADELWHWYAGAPLELNIGAEIEQAEPHLMGPDVAGGEIPQVLVPKHAWQNARSLGAWTLVGCTVAPGFSFDGFEMAEDG